MGGVGGEGPFMRLNTAVEGTPMSAVCEECPRTLLFTNNRSRFDISRGVGILFNGLGSRFLSNKFDSIKEARCRLISIKTTDLTHLPLTPHQKVRKPVIQPKMQEYQNNQSRPSRLRRTSPMQQQSPNLHHHLVSLQRGYTIVPKS